MKCTQICIHAGREQQVIDLFPELVKAGMPGSDANPKHSWRSFLREGPHAFDGQYKRFDANVTESLEQHLLHFQIDLAEEAEGDMKLFDRCPPYIPRRWTKRGHRGPDQGRWSKRDKQALRDRRPRHHIRTLPKAPESQLRPVEIEADADAFVVDAIGGDLVTEPALEQNKISSLGRIRDVRFVDWPR
jgi:hypothetical protein